MQRRPFLSTVAVVSLLALAACGGGGGDAAPSPSPTPAPVSPGVLSISAMPRLDPFPTTPQQYATVAQEAFDLAWSAGARGQMNTWTWRAMEPTAGTFATQPFADLAAAVATAAGRGMVQYVGLQPINTGVLELPVDLAGQALDSTVVQNRFKALLDRVIVPNRGRIRYLSLGNEVDAYLRAHPADWARYTRFFTAMVAYAKQLDPALQVGVTATAEGALSLSTAELRTLNAASDVVVLTYYPLQFSGAGEVRVRGPGVVAADFAALLAFAGAKPLLLQEVGYPAAASTGSSVQQQAQFVRNVFAAWKAAPARVPFLNVFLMHDFTAQICADFVVYYGATGSSTFADFLCTLGLRQADGTKRPAWDALVEEAHAAGLP